MVLGREGVLYAVVLEKEGVLGREGVLYAVVLGREGVLGSFCCCMQ